MSKSAPWISITGCTNWEEVGELCRWAITGWRGDELPSLMYYEIDRVDGNPAFLPIDLAINYLVSEKSWLGLPTRHQNLVGRQELEHTCWHYPGLHHLVHYNCASDQGLANRLIEIFSLEGDAGIDGFQVNLPFPDPVQLQAVKQHMFNSIRGYNIPKEDDWHRIIFWLNRHVIHQMEEDPGKVVKGLKPYLDLQCITDVLWDMSGGEGLPLDPAEALKYLLPIQAEYPHLHLRVGGGLGPENNEEALCPIIEHIPELSVEAQSKLCSSGSEVIDLEKAYLFLLDTARILNSNRAALRKQ